MYLLKLAEYLIQWCFAYLFKNEFIKIQPSSLSSPYTNLIQRLNTPIAIATECKIEHDSKTECKLDRSDEKRLPPHKPIPGITLQCRDGLWEVKVPFFPLRHQPCLVTQTKLKCCVPGGFLAGACLGAHQRVKWSWCHVQYCGLIRETDLCCIKQDRVANLHWGLHGKI